MEYVWHLKIIDIANEYPFDGFYFGDDWGQQKGLIMGPALWREFIKPRMKRMYERAKLNDKYIFQHSCGDIHEIFSDVIEIGLDCYQTFQPEIYNIEKVKNEYGKDLTFWGGISTQQLLPYATSDDVKKETIRIMRIMGKGGGYIAAPTHAVPGDVPPENILAMFEVFKNQNKYL
jgi:uroporphyrinogen decarboxylase